jgi:hypothetical protein
MKRIERILTFARMLADIYEKSDQVDVQMHIRWSLREENHEVYIKEIG